MKLPIGRITFGPTITSDNLRPISPNNKRFKGAFKGYEEIAIERLSERVSELEKRLSELEKATGKGQI